jgi:hypothetical protein
LTRLRNWNGTVHWAIEGRVVCGPLASHDALLRPSTVTVTCKRCVARFGSGSAAARLGHEPDAGVGDGQADENAQSPTASPRSARRQAQRRYA